jgi:hypothetical protein
MPKLPKDAFIEAVEEEWPAAVSHAGIPEERLSLWMGRTSPEQLKDVAAQHFAPHLDPDPPYAFSPDQHAEATSLTMRDKHRIVVHLEYDYPDALSPEAVQALLGALLRHELEHARQVERWGPDLFYLYQRFLLPAMGRFFGGWLSGVYLNSVPIELDANAAASDFLREHHPEHRQAILATGCANLARAVQPPQPLDTLMDRMIAFLFIYRQQIEELTVDLSVAACLEVYNESAASAWKRLVKEAD